MSKFSDRFLTYIGKKLLGRDWVVTAAAIERAAHELGEEAVIRFFDGDDPDGKVEAALARKPEVGGQKSEVGGKK